MTENIPKMRCPSCKGEGYNIVHPHYTQSTRKKRSSLLVCPVPSATGKRRFQRTAREVELVKE